MSHTSENKLKVFELDDYTWFVGYDLESCIQEAIRSFNMYPKWMEGAYEISETQLDELKFINFEKLYSTGIREEWSFREQLKIEAEKGGEFPRAFAFSEG